MIVLVYLYRVLILPVASLVANTYYLVRYWGVWQTARVEVLNQIGRVKSFISLYEFVSSKKFTYKPDEIKGTFNFVPWSYTVFYVRGGGDCSVWARIIYRLLDSLGYEPELWMIMDGANVSTAHVVPVFLRGETWYFFNVWQLQSAPGARDAKSALLSFSNRELIRHKGKAYRYKNIKRYRWF